MAGELEGSARPMLKEKETAQAKGECKSVSGRIMRAKPVYWVDPGGSGKYSVTLLHKVEKREKPLKIKTSQKPGRDPDLERRDWPPKSGLHSGPELATSHNA